MKNKKFSDLVSNLTEIWLLWMKNNNACKDENLPIKVRREAADTCEDLINKRDILVNSIDKFFPA